MSASLSLHPSQMPSAQIWPARGSTKLSSLAPGHSINNICPLLSWGLGPGTLRSSHEPWRHSREVWEGPC